MVGVHHARGITLFYDRFLPWILIVINNNHQKKNIEFILCFSFVFDFQYSNHLPITEKKDLVNGSIGGALKMPISSTNVVS